MNDEKKGVKKMRTFAKSSKLDNVCYDIRGPVMDEANRMIEQGVEILKLANANDSINLTELLAELAKREITSVLVEGGAKTQASFFENDLVQQIHAYIAPKTIGGEQALSVLAGLGAENMKDAKQWQFTHIKPLSPDVLLIAERVDV